MNWRLVNDDHPLTLRLVLERMRGMYGDARSSRSSRTGRRRTSYAELGERVDRLAAALRDARRRARRPRRDVLLEHAGAPRALPGGAVHRRGAAHREHPPLRRGPRVHLQPRRRPACCSSTRRWPSGSSRCATELRDASSAIVVIGDEYEELLAAQPPGFDYPDARRPRAGRALLHERHHRQARRASSTRTARRCCTRSACCAADAIGVSSADRVLPVVPMFHANAWGLPYAAAMTGADLLLPGRFTAARAAAAT